MLDDGNQYVYGAGPTSMKQSGSWFYYLADGLGSTMAVVDASGVSQKLYQYDVYGKVTGGAGTLANEFDFAGQQTDATGLQYLRARYYDPETGTFLSREPLADDPSWLGNNVGYAAGNPVVFVDPAGHRLVDSGEHIGGAACYSVQCAFVYYDSDYSGGSGIDWGDVADSAIGAADEVADLVLQSGEAVAFGGYVLSYEALEALGRLPDGLEIVFLEEEVMLVGSQAALLALAAALDYLATGNVTNVYNNPDGSRAESDWWPDGVVKLAGGTQPNATSHVRSCQESPLMRRAAACISTSNGRLDIDSDEGWEARP